MADRAGRLAAVTPATTSAAIQLAAATTRYVLLSRFGGVGDGAPGLSPPADPEPPPDVRGSSAPIVEDLPAAGDESASPGDAWAPAPVPDAPCIGTSRAPSPNSILKIVSSTPTGHTALDVCPK